MNYSPPEHPSTRSAVGSLRLSGAIALCLVTLPFVLKAAAPGWWTDRGVTDPSLTANDYVAVNQGQVKNMAKQAMQEMDAWLPGGAGETVHALVATWGAPTAATNDFTTVNLGQIKRLAEPFYDRLIYAKYTTVYPWNGSLAQANNYAAANIGQVKNLFSFDLISTDAAHDVNGDGLPDWWENFYQLSGVSATGTLPWNGNLTYQQAFQQGLNPKDFYNNQAPMFVGHHGDNQEGAPNEFLPLPLTVSVVANGQPLINAPITFWVSKGSGQVQRSSNSTPNSTITVLTDYTGQAKVYFKLSPEAGDENEVTAKPGSGGYTAPVQPYPESTDRSAGTNDSPFNPSNVVATMNRDGSADVSWTDNADPTDLEPIDIMYRDRNGQWQVLTNVPAGTTSYHIPAP